MILSLVSLSKSDPAHVSDLWYLHFGKGCASPSSFASSLRGKHHHHDLVSAQIILFEMVLYFFSFLFARFATARPLVK